jgi:hypothetical protein
VYDKNHHNFPSYLDEEIGGQDGMETFCESKGKKFFSISFLIRFIALEFQELNVAVALDEGIASPNDSYCIFYGERAAWCEYLVCIESILNVMEY